MPNMRQKYNLDVIPGGAPVVIHLHQNDITGMDGGREITLALFSRNGNLSFPYDAQAYIEGVKPDGTFFSYDALLQDTEVTYQIEEQMTTVSGDSFCQCKVASGGSVLMAANFIHRVQSDVVNRAPISSTEVPGLVAQAQAAAAAAEAAARNIETNWFISGARNIFFEDIKPGDGTVVGALNDLLPIRGEGEYNDFNMYRKNGWYYINPVITTLNNPTDGESGTLEVIQPTQTTYILQRYTTTINRGVYCRVYGAGAWSEWTQIGGIGGDSYTLNSIAPAGSLNRVTNAGIWYLSAENSYNQLPSDLSSNPECVMEVVKANGTSSTIVQRLFALENNKLYIRRTVNGGTSWSTWEQLGKVTVEAISDTASEYNYKGIRVKGRKYGNVVYISIFGTASENLGGMMSYLNLCELPEGWQSIIDPQQNHLINVSNAIWGTVSVFGRTVRLGWFRKLDNGTWAQTNVDQGTQLITSFCYICSG